MKRLDKCGSCIYLDKEDKTSVGYFCTCNTRKFKNDVARRKQLSNVKCSAYKLDPEYVATKIVRVNIKEEMRKQISEYEGTLERVRTGTGHDVNDNNRIIKALEDEISNLQIMYLCG